MSKVLLSNDGPKRGLEPSGFVVVCDCGDERKYVLTDNGWDIYPCPHCKAPGVTNSEIKEQTK